MVYTRPSELYPPNWNRLRHFIFKRDHYRCRLCGRYTRNPVCHHIIPVRLGGTHSPNNLITLCPECHKKIHRIW